MERHENFNGFEFDANRATPHFSDARVIQAARPVVPLAEAANRNHRKSRFVLTGAFAAAMLLGAAVALIAARLERQRFQSAAIEVSKVQTNNPSVTADDQQPAPTEKLEEVAHAEEPKTGEPEISNDHPSLDAVESTVKASRPITKSPNVGGTQPRHQDEALSNASADPIADPTDDHTENPQPVMVDQWQERRLRRIEKLDRRARRAAQGQDLMRIDEIFEGVRRP
jgi:hypothetical protein